MIGNDKIIVEETKWSKNDELRELYNYLQSELELREADNQALEALDVIYRVSRTEPKEQWISVDERLPEKYYETFKGNSRKVKYIVALENGNVLPAEFHKESYDGSIKNYFRPINHARVLRQVTHWMPMPEAPNE